MKKDYYVYIDGYALLICGKCHKGELACRCKRKAGEKND